MTATIHRLDRRTIDSIAAGEVIERPASVVKELIDNALDAGAGVIRLAIENGGIRLISCEDDGQGMSPEDALLALESHATSKLSSTDDLFQLKTLGFRGEALPSIAAVSRFELRTRTHEDASEGYRVAAEGGKIVFSGPCGIAPGTMVTCRDLFFNTPARYKFLKSDAAEGSAVADITGKAALARPDVSFRLDRDSERREVLYTPGNNDLLSAIYAVFGADTAGAMIPVESETPPVRVSGYVSSPEAARHNRSRQIFIVNGRVIYSATLRAAVEEASKTWFMRGNFPQLVLNVAIPFNLVDVNVHPQKLEVRFWDERAVFRAVYRALRAAFEQGARLVEAAWPGASSAEVSDGRKAGTIESRDKNEPVSKPVEPRVVLPPNSSAGLFAYNGADSRKTDKTIPSRVRLPMVGEESEKCSADDHAARPARPSEDAAPMADEQNRIAAMMGTFGTIDTLGRSRLIGTLFDTYILLDSGDAMILVDQHAAHERILYEEMLLRRKENPSGNAPGQVLLIPVHVTLDEAEKAVLEDEGDYLRTLGFEYEPFGGQSVVIRAVPSGGKGQPPADMDPAKAFRAALDQLEICRSDGRTVDDTEILHEIACKAAVKAHDRLSESEIRQLLSRLADLTNPYHCPHGRPVAIKMTKPEIEKLFGRIV